MSAYKVGMPLSQDRSPVNKPISSQYCRYQPFRLVCLDRSFAHQPTMAADKVPTIVESASSNDGARTVLHAVMAPGAKTYPHYHTSVSETFTLHKGPLTIYKSPDLSEASWETVTVQAGQSVTLHPRELHYFLVGEEEVTVTMTFEPGTLDFERAMLIMRGTQRDGTYRGYDDLIVTAVLGELTETTGIGEMKKMLDGLYASRGEEIKDRKRELVEKYASDEQLRTGGDV